MQFDVRHFCFEKKSSYSSYIFIFLSKGRNLHGGLGNMHKTEGLCGRGTSMILKLKINQKHAGLQLINHYCDCVRYVVMFYLIIASGILVLIC